MEFVEGLRGVSNHLAGVAWRAESKQKTVVRMTYVLVNHKAALGGDSLLVIHGDNVMITSGLYNDQNMTGRVCSLFQGV